MMLSAVIRPATAGGLIGPGGVPGPGTGPLGPVWAWARRALPLRAKKTNGRRRECRDIMEVAPFSNFGPRFAGTFPADQPRRPGFRFGPTTFVETVRGVAKS